MEPPRSADELLASTLRTGDVVVFNRYCRSLAPSPRRACLGSKYWLSATPRLLGPRGAGGARPAHRRRVPPRGRRRRRDDAHVRGADGRVCRRHRGGAAAPAPRRPTRRPPGSTGCCATSCGCGCRPTASTRPGASRCDNLAEVYRCPRSRRRASRGADGDADAGCNFGAPLVARGLQRLGLVDGGVAVERVTPVQLRFRRGGRRRWCSDRTDRSHLASSRCSHLHRVAPHGTARATRHMVLLTTISTIRGVFGGAGRALMATPPSSRPSAARAFEAEIRLAYLGTGHRIDLGRVSRGADGGVRGKWRPSWSRSTARAACRSRTPSSARSTPPTL